MKFAETKKWKVSTTSFTEGTVGGYKEIIMTVSGEGVYGVMKYESGVHRVQRVPQTETQGRVHTSAATVAVLPEAEDFEVEIKLSSSRPLRRTTGTGATICVRSAPMYFGAVRRSVGRTGCCRVSFRFCCNGKAKFRTVPCSTVDYQIQSRRLQERVHHFLLKSPD